MKEELVIEAGEDEVREQVRRHYGESAIAVRQSSCCGAQSASSNGGCCSSTAPIDPVAANLYSAEETRGLPSEAVAAALGCGNPTLLAKLNPGETVLDLGSGGGIDVLLSARRVGPTGFVYGLDMTDEMLALAEENRRKAGVENVRFLRGYIEDIPLPEASVDVIISNCVVNLSVDKARVLKEAFRVLKPGGRFAVSDVIMTGEAPEEIRKSMEAWTGCIAGALHQETFKKLLAEAGFTDIEVQITQRYAPSELVGDECSCSLPANLGEEDLRQADGLFASAFVRAVKPKVQ